MKQLWRRACAAVNPVSTAATRWWCHAALRQVLTGAGPTARQRRRHRQVIRDRRPRVSAALLPPGQNAARARLTDDLLAGDDRRPAR